jgi:hypothetical protein
MQKHLRQTSHASEDDVVAVVQAEGQSPKNPQTMIQARRHPADDKSTDVMLMKMIQMMT